MEDIKIKNAENSLGPIFWQARVKITQIPSVVEKESILNPNAKHMVEIDKSWLFDPFLNRTVYGLEVTLNRNFNWIFYLITASKAEAIRKGHAYLMALEEKFPGLTGEVEALPITSSILNQNFPIYELVLPRRPYNERKYFSIIKKVVQLFKRNEHNSFQFFIIWQRDDSVVNRKLSEISILELYKTKLYIQIIKDDSLDSGSEYETSKLRGQLEYLTMGIQNLKGVRASIKQIYINKWGNVLASNVFWVNKKDIHTNHYYHDISHQLHKERLPSFISPDLVDFNFLKELPLLKANTLPYENINYLPNSSEEVEISIGNLVSNGVPTNHTKYLPLKHFAHSVFIAGQPGAGKTYLLGHILKQFHEKAKDVGVLILNLGKAHQEGYFKTNQVLKYGSPDFHLNYFYKGEYLDKALQETASYLIASLGLGSPCDKIMYLVMKAFIRTNGALPRSLKELFKGLKKWFREHPYDKKYQTNILRALENRISTILSDPILDKTLAQSSTSDMPSWFQEWNEGKTIYIDLCMCNIYLKRLLTSAIFQMVRTLTPDREAEKLQNVIVIDEAHQILEEPVSNDPNSDEFISKEQLKLIFNHLMREFRSKGLSFILADNVPHSLFSCTTTLPSLKILFILDHLDMNVFTKNPQIQDYLLLQAPRNALIMNGNNEEIYVIRTPDYQYSIK